MKRSWLLALLLAGSLVTLNSPAFADEASTDAQEDVNSAIGALTKQVNDLASKGPSVEIHGFAQADFINDSTQSFNETVGDGKVAVPGVTAPATIANGPGDNGYSQFSTRNSRISLLSKESMGDWNFKGYIETDFLGASNSASNYKLWSQPTLRIRHAYVQADQNGGWTFLAGQWWSQFGWNMDYVLATVAEPPVMATLYERVPQFRIQYTTGDSKGMQLQFGIGAEQPDQEISQVPTQTAGIRLLLNDMKGFFCSSTGKDKMVPFSIGISGRNALYVWGDGLSTPLNDKLDQSIWASAIAGDIQIPVLPAAEGKDDPSIVLTGEYTYGAGDTLPYNGGGFGGAPNINQSVGGGLPTGGYGISATNPVYTEVDNGAVAAVNGGLTPLIIQGYNGQIQITLPKSVGTIVGAGYGEVFCTNASVAQTGATGGKPNVSYNDDNNYFVNVMQDLSKNTRIALEYDQFVTHYVNGTQGTDQRLQLSSWYYF
jgi:hypothetical protein